MQRAPLREFVCSEYVARYVLRALRMSKDDIREFRDMLVPTTIEQLSLAFITMLISFLVKKSGMQAVAAVNMLNQLSMLFQQVTIAIGVAVSILVAQFRGRGDALSAGKAAQQGMIIIVLVSSVLGAVGLIFREQILRILFQNSEPLIYDYGRSYFTFILLSLPFSGLYTVSAAVMRGSGFARTSLGIIFTYNGIYAILATLSSLLTDFGVMGVCYSILISSIIGSIVALIYLFKGNANFTIERFTLRLDRKILKPMILLGIPVLLENMFFTVGRLITNSFSIPHGTNQMAANGIVNNISQVMCSPIMAAVNAASPIVGRYLGMDNKTEAKRKGNQLLIFMIVLQTSIALVSLVFLNPLSKMMSDVIEIQMLVKQVLFYYSLAMPVGFTIGFVVPAIMRSSGDTRYILIVNTITMFTMRIGVSYLLAIILNFGFGGIWIGMYSDWVVRIIFFMPRFIKGKWLQRSVLEKDTQ